MCCVGAVPFAQTVRGGQHEVLTDEASPARPHWIVVLTPVCESQVRHVWELPMSKYFLNKKARWESSHTHAHITRSGVKGPQYSKNAVGYVTAELPEDIRKCRTSVCSFAFFTFKELSSKKLTNHRLFSAIISHGQNELTRDQSLNLV